MKGEDKGITVRILDKEFRVNCPNDKEEELFEAASYLDKHMRQIKSHGRVIGLERIAIMAALNITHELTRLKNQAQEADPALRDRLQALQHKIDDALSEGTRFYGKMHSEADLEESKEFALKESALD